MKEIQNICLNCIKFNECETIRNIHFDIEELLDDISEIDGVDVNTEYRVIRCKDYSPDLVKLLGLRIDEEDDFDEEEEEDEDTLIDLLEKMAEDEDDETA